MEEKGKEEIKCTANEERILSQTKGANDSEEPLCRVYWQVGY